MKLPPLGAFGTGLLFLAASPPSLAGPIAFPPPHASEPGAVLGADVGVYKRTLSLGGGGQQDFLSRQLLARIAFCPLSRISLYLLGGVADGERIEGGFAGRADGLWGGGLKAALLDPADHDVNVALDVQADTFQSEMGGSVMRVVEAAAAPHITSRWDQLTFSGGLRLSQVEIDQAGRTDVSRDPLGFFLGLDYYVHPNVGFSGEIHVFDENAVYLGVGYRF